MNRQLNTIARATMTGCLIMLFTVSASAQECGDYEVTAVIVGPQCGGFGLTAVLPSAINENGDVVGRIACLGAGDQAFLWTAKDGLQFIPMPDGTNESKALAISGSKIVGLHFVSGDKFGQLAFLYDYQTDEFTTLWPLPGAVRSEAHAINSKGEIVGFFGGGEFASQLAFIWRDNEMINLNPDFGTVKSQAEGINANSAVTGWMGVSKLTDSRAFIWDKGKVTELPELPGGTTSEGHAINAQGDVAGLGRFFDPKLKATVKRAFASVDGKAINLGTIPGHERSIATGINNAQTTVGFFFSPGTVAFMWQDGNMIVLNDLVSPSEGLSIDLARGINQNGQIISQGHSDPLDATVGIIITPIIGLPGDLNSDCQITTVDLLLLFGEWGTCKGCPADLDGNGTVNVSDLLILFSNWG